MAVSHMSTRKVGVRKDGRSFAFMYYFCCGLGSQTPVSRMAENGFCQVCTTQDIATAEELLARYSGPNKTEYYELFRARLLDLQEVPSMLVAA